MRYGISGLLGGAIKIFFLFAWVTLLGFQRTYLIGLSIGFVVALLTLFLFQKYWAFRDRNARRAPRQLLSYTAVALSGLALNIVLLASVKAAFGYFSVDFFHGWYVAAEVVITGIVAVFNFSMNLLFTFREARTERLRHG